MKTTTFKSNDELQQFLTELYVFLIDEMHANLQKVNYPKCYSHRNILRLVSLYSHDHHHSFAPGVLTYLFIVLEPDLFFLRAGVSHFLQPSLQASRSVYQFFLTLLPACLFLSPLSIFSFGVPFFEPLTTIFFAFS